MTYDYLILYHNKLFPYYIIGGGLVLVQAESVSNL